MLVGEASDGRRRQLARALHALGPAAVVVTGGHRDEATDLFFDGGELDRRSPASAIRTAPRTARAARTRPRSPPISRSAAPRSRRRGRPARSPARPSGTACAVIGAGPGPVDVFDLTGADRPCDAADAPEAASTPVAA